MSITASLVLIVAQGRASEMMARSLTASDLAKSPRSLRTRIERLLPGRMIGRGPVEIEGERHGWIVAMQRPTSDFVVNFALRPRGTRVTVSRFFVTSNGQGGMPNVVRRRGDRIFGLFSDVHGNWMTPTAVVLDAENFRVVSRTESPLSIHSGRFRDPRGLDLVVTTRSYDHRTLSQPHAGPLLLIDSVWRLQSGRYVPGPKSFRPTALYAFDLMVDALGRGDSAFVAARCDKPEFLETLRRELDALNGSRRISVTMPHSRMSDTGRVFAFRQDGPFFELAERDGRWRIVRVAPESAFPLTIRVL